MPVNDFIDRTEFSDSPFNLTIEPFDFSVGLGVFQTCDDVFDLMMIEEIFEFALIFPVGGKLIPSCILFKGTNNSRIF